MTQTLSTKSVEKSASPFSTILLAGLLAGFLDGAAASVSYYINTGNNPTRVFQYIASAVFGKQAYSGGMGMVVWGLVFHFVIALAFAAVFFVVYPVLFRIIKNRIVIGVVYGLMVWVIMSLVVVPLTKAAQFAFNLQAAIIGMLILVFMVGIPIALIVHRYFAIRKASLVRI
ncbi:MAG: hypothetical protein H7122_12405 [Chitinophagaceae bacterium]|nr:hypothetical protein [Chitinophagaceae bacterium]